jgi:hypothetical protein
VSNLAVADSNVPDLIKKLKTSEWLIPLFQRDFVWSNAAIINLINSIIDARPIGMITLWEQEGNSPLPLEPISIADSDGLIYFGSRDERPGRYYAVLDGRQRSTAIALAFGGLRAKSGKYRNAGRYYLDVTAKEENERVKYFSEKDVTRRKLDHLNVAISNGLFPLEVVDPDNIFNQWMEYIQKIRDPEYYIDQNIPDEAELSRRNKILQLAFNGIIKTKVATYTVPKTYNLSEICDIFENLNTTGTKVSTVDLIHSNIYSDTASWSSGPILLRDHIDEMGQLDGAIGWASSRERPELIAQFAAAIHVALDTKSTARAMGGAKEQRISSVKSADLLALPASHWKTLFDHNVEFASYIGGFQTAVAGGSFTMPQCPYPASAAIYIALRWYLNFDAQGKVEWGIKHLDAIYRAFFWRNALETRYDQGFLSQIGTDLLKFKTFLGEVGIDSNFDNWRSEANIWLTENVVKIPSRDTIIEYLLDGSEAGALRKSILLLYYARAERDVIDTSISLFGDDANSQLHHIYPRDWVENSLIGSLAEFTRNGGDIKSRVNCAANLMPMARTSNLSWRKKVPSQFLSEAGVSYDMNAKVWNAYFIDRDAFELLIRDDPSPIEFWQKRAELIADEICARMVV